MRINNNYTYITQPVQMIFPLLQKWNDDQANDRYSGSMMWPGADYTYQGKNITYFKSFDQDYDFFKRVDEVSLIEGIIVVKKKNASSDDIYKIFTKTTLSIYFLKIRCFEHLGIHQLLPLSSHP